MKKTTLFLKALPLASALFLVNCSDVAAPVVNEQIESAEQEYNEKNGKSRSVSWTRVQSIPNARDIAAYEKVYAISSDGRSIYEWTPVTNKFNKITEDAHKFENDPAVKIAAGAEIVKTDTIAPHITRTTTYEGAHVITESGKVYSLLTINSANSGRGWEERSLPVTAEGIGVDNKGLLYIFDDKGARDDLYLSWGSFNWSDMTRFSLEHDIVAMDGGNTSYAHDLYRAYGAYFLTSDSRVYSVVDSRAGYKLQQRNTQNIIPTKDIAAHPSWDQEFAVFHNNTDIVYFFPSNGEAAVNCGPCRSISISKDNHLWDAYGTAIYKAKLY